MILLDTCALIWLVGEQERFAAPTRTLIERHAGAVYVSAISALEIGLKHRKGKLRLPTPPLEWYAAALRAHGLLEAPVTGRVALRSTLLPPLHGDPADRILVASAIEQGWTLVTPDPLVHQYKEATVFWA